MTVCEVYEQEPMWDTDSSCFSWLHLSLIYLHLHHTPTQTQGCMKDIVWSDFHSTSIHQLPSLSFSYTHAPYPNKDIQSLFEYKARLEKLFIW